VSTTAPPTTAPQPHQPPRASIRTARRRPSLGRRPRPALVRRLVVLAAVAAASSACTAAHVPVVPVVPEEIVRISTENVAGTTLHVEQRGDGPPLLLVHGAGEDVTMLAGQAEALAAAGYRVISYDRRGTGASGREDWPGAGADQHADDAAALLGALGAAPATVLGVSSGGVVAMALAARHPDAVTRVVAWEPPAAGVLHGADAATAAIMEPVEAHLREHPDDWVGAQALLLTAILGFPVSSDDPAFAAARANAEPMVRDDPTITLRPFTAAELTAAPVTVAVGTAPNELVDAATAVLAELTGTERAVVPGADHEVYLTDPAVLAALIEAPTP
jgi:pimeloyl-ACP methyl ester carboxylesterase